MLIILQTQLYPFSSGLRKHTLSKIILKNPLNLFRVEENVLIACACIPTLGPFFRFLQSKDLKGAFRAVSQSWKTRDHSDRIALKDYNSSGQVKESDGNISEARQDVESLDSLEKGSRA